jgi:hypothetical protein
MTKPLLGLGAGTEKAISRGTATRIDQILQMLRRPEGATLTQISRRVGWQRHSVRGAIAGTVKRCGHKVERARTAAGVYVYRVGN